MKYLIIITFQNWTKASNFLHLYLNHNPNLVPLLLHNLMFIRIFFYKIKKKLIRCFQLNLTFFFNLWIFIACFFYHFSNWKYIVSIFYLVCIISNRSKPLVFFLILCYKMCSLLIIKDTQIEIDYNLRPVISPISVLNCRPHKYCEIINSNNLCWCSCGFRLSWTPSCYITKSCNKL